MLDMTGNNYKPIKTAGIVIAAGLCYFVLIKTTGIYIPCMFRLITGFKCPGCGITTMITALASLDFEAAFNANPFLFVTAPLLCGELIYRLYARYMNREISRIHDTAVICYAAALCVFGVVRNMIEYGIL